MDDSLLSGTAQVGDPESGGLNVVWDGGMRIASIAHGRLGQHRVTLSAVRHGREGVGPVAVARRHSECVLAGDRLWIPVEVGVAGQREAVPRRWYRLVLCSRRRMFMAVIVVQVYRVLVLMRTVGMMRGASFVTAAVLVVLPHVGVVVIVLPLLAVVLVRVCIVRVVSAATLIAAAIVFVVVRLGVLMVMAVPVAVPVFHCCNCSSPRKLVCCSSRWASTPELPTDRNTMPAIALSSSSPSTQGTGKVGA
jgi:hypothetical protein